MRRFVLYLGIALAVTAAPAHAHHTYVKRYDSAKKVTISGTISSVSYTNPHIFFSVEAGGATWLVETESLSVAHAKGLTQALLKDGASVTVRGWPARDGAAVIGLQSITFKGGPSITVRGSPR